MSGTAEHLFALKNVNLTDCPVTFWVVRRSMHNREARYHVLRMEAEDELRLRLRNLLADHIGSCTHAEEYEYVTGDQDDIAYTVALSETDFAGIKEQVEAGTEADKVESVKDLVGAWGYLIKVDSDPEPVYAFRKASTLWSKAKAKALVNTFWDGERLMVLKEEQVFRVDNRIDFVGFGDRLYILDKRQFEIALNFREGMEQKRDELLQEFHDLGLFHDIEVFRAKIQNNYHLLRKVAAIHKRGYYREATFMQRLLELNEEKGWGLQIDGPLIVVTDDTIELVLTLIGNDRLKSEINEEEFDIRGSKLKVNGSPS